MKKLLIAIAALVFAGAAYGQTISGGQYAQTSVLFTAPSTSWVVPPNVTVIFIDGCASGGGGAGGQASASTAGGGGGGAGECIRNWSENVTPGSTLTIAVPAAAVGGTAGLNGGAFASPSTISGLPSGGTLTLYSGCPGLTGAAGTGGVGGGGAGQCQSVGYGAAGGLAGAAGSDAAAYGDPIWTGPGGGGGGATAGTAGAAGRVLVATNILPTVYGAPTRAAGAGNGAGGGGAPTIFGSGQSGTAAGVSCNASPTWIGYGGGGCGGGSNASGGSGGPGFIRIRY